MALRTLQPAGRDRALGVERFREIADGAGGARLIGVFALVVAFVLQLNGPRRIRTPSIAQAVAPRQLEPLIAPRRDVAVAIDGIGERAEVDAVTRDVGNAVGQRGLFLYVVVGVWTVLY
jgi:hypothetical protein